jgi:hypothetical protein
MESQPLNAKQLRKLLDSLDKPDSPEVVIVPEGRLTHVWRGNETIRLKVETLLEDLETKHICYSKRFTSSVLVDGDIDNVFFLVVFEGDAVTAYPFPTQESPPHYEIQMQNILGGCFENINHNSEKTRYLSDHSNLRCSFDICEEPVGEINTVANKLLGIKTVIRGRILCTSRVYDMEDQMFDTTFFTKRQLNKLSEKLHVDINISDVPIADFVGNTHEVTGKISMTTDGDAELWIKDLRNSVALEDKKFKEQRNLEKKCKMCDSLAKSVCSSCNKARYCSAACQKSDWKLHKLSCKEK